MTHNPTPPANPGRFIPDFKASFKNAQGNKSWWTNPTNKPRGTGEAGYKPDATRKDAEFGD